MQERPLAPARRGTVELPRGEAGLRPGGALAMPRHPALDPGEPLQDLGREPPVAHGADVEQEIPALPRHLAERVDELASGLEVPIVRVVGPALVDGETGLPRAPGRL